MQIAIGTYTTKHGTEAIAFATLAKTLDALPKMTNKVLEDSGALEPDVEGEDATEDFAWAMVAALDDLPILKIRQPPKRKRK